MIAGPNGSGKTTLTNQLRRDGVDLGRYINPDEIAKTLSGSYEDRVREAQTVADRERALCLKHGTSFSFETVMSHSSKVHFLKIAKIHYGFRIAIYFLATESVDLNVDRVRQRVALGGHDVPEAKIRSRYQRALDLLPLAMAEADDVVLFDNSSRRPAVIRPFFQRSGARVTIQSPVPDWAKPAIKPWLAI